MDFSLRNTIKQFLKHHKIQGKVLLGFSGGVDSMVLLHLLLEVQKSVSIKIFLAHLDHGLRESSRSESLWLENYAKKYDLPFYSIRLNLTCKKNLEDVCRKKRIQFFMDLHKKYKFSGLFLAHHQDDLAETTLKRLFEGAKLFQLAPMQKKIFFENITLYRPLLDFPKKALVEYAQKNGLSYIEDSTNFDQSNLRSVMRMNLIPMLEKTFGKGIQKNLARLAIRSDEFTQYMKKKISKIQNEKISGPFGDLFDCHLLEGPEIGYFFYQYLKNKQISLTSNQLDTLRSWVEEQKSNKSLQIGELNIHVDRGYVFFQIKPITMKNWKFTSEQCSLQKCRSIHWNDIIRGRLELILPSGNYKLQTPSEDILKKYSSRKIPNFLRKAIPVLHSDSLGILDFLSQQHLSYSEGDQKVSIVFRE